MIKPKTRIRTANKNAVRKAYKEYRTLNRRPDIAEISDYLSKHGSSATVKGLYRKSIILRSALKGKKIFQSIRPEGFYKI